MVMGGGPAEIAQLPAYPCPTPAIACPFARASVCGSLRTPGH
jgi:hypothetical protein